MYRANRSYAGGAGPHPSVIGNENLEEDNTRHEDELRSKIGALKSLTIDIGHEVREHNRLLKDIDDGFDSAGGLLRTSMNKVLALAKSGSRYHFLYLFLFCLFVFLVIWLIK